MLLIGSRVTVGIVTSDTGVVAGVPLPASSFGVTFTSVPGFSGSLFGVGTLNVPSGFTGTLTTLPLGNLTSTVVFGSGFGTLPVTTVEVLLIGSRVTVGVVVSTKPASPPALSAAPLTPPILSAPLALFRSPIERKFSLMFE